MRISERKEETTDKKQNATLSALLSPWWLDASATTDIPRIFCDEIYRNAFVLSYLPYLSIICRFFFYCSTAVVIHYFSQQVVARPRLIPIIPSISL